MKRTNKLLKREMLYSSIIALVVFLIFLPNSFNISYSLLETLFPHDAMPYDFGGPNLGRALISGPILSILVSLMAYRIGMLLLKSIHKLKK